MAYFLLLVIMQFSIVGSDSPSIFRADPSARFPPSLRVTPTSFAVAGSPFWNQTMAFHVPLEGGEIMVLAGPFLLLTTIFFPPKSIFSS